MNESTTTQQDTAQNTSTSVPVQTPTDPKAAHEAAKANRKAEWDAKQADKKAALDKAIADVRAMNNEDVSLAAAKRLGDHTERITQREMKICVTEHVQALCKTDAVFARKTMHPRKNMKNCFKYIGRLALEHLKKEAKTNGETLEYIAYPVAEELCYQWAIQYFLDANAEEDKEKEDEFVPKKYYGSSSSTPKRQDPPKPAPVKQQVGLNFGGDEDDSL